MPPERQAVDDDIRSNVLGSPGYFVADIKLGVMGVSLPLNPIAVEEMLAQIAGENLEDFRREAALRQQLQDEADGYRDLPAQAWPPLQFNWDFAVASQRFALDGVKPDEFLAMYPSGLLLGRAPLAKFDEKLCHFSRRDGPSELWELGFKHALAYLIAYLAHGHPITPPLVAPAENNELIIRGGHHRYAVAKAVGLLQLPFYVQPKHRAGIERRVPVQWTMPSK